MNESANTVGYLFQSDDILASSVVRKLIWFTGIGRNLIFRCLRTKNGSEKRSPSIYNSFSIVTCCSRILSRWSSHCLAWINQNKQLLTFATPTLGGLLEDFPSAAFTAGTVLSSLFDLWFKFVAACWVCCWACCCACCCARIACKTLVIKIQNRDPLSSNKIWMRCVDMSQFSLHKNEQYSCISSHSTLIILEIITCVGRTQSRRSWWITSNTL